jgi:gamma-glutamyltranspeptidase/glutathione hydrolase
MARIAASERCPMRTRLWHIIALSGLLLSACSQGATREVNWRFWQSSDASGDFMVASAHPHATRAGVDILARGGNAVDAAIAVEMVLGVVEPESSGLGGGSFILYWQNKDRTLQSYDGRETAPTWVGDKSLSQVRKGSASFMQRVAGGKYVAVPGTVAVLKQIHDEHGKLPWSDLFDHAIELAENGFEVSPKLHMWVSSLPSVQTLPRIKAFLTNDGIPHPVGTIVQNRDLADSLRKVAAGGADAFYHGSLSEEISHAIRNAKINPVEFEAGNLKTYQAVRRDPVCGPYRDWKICSMGPPSSGGITLLQIMAMLEPQDMATLEPGSVEAVHLIAEASRLAFADRNFYIADSDFVVVPVDGLLDPAYLAARATLIEKTASGSRALPGDLKSKQPPSNAGDDAEKLPSTSHVSIIDGQGNAVSMTSSVGFAFGSSLMAGGFFLNNHLTDFAGPKVIEDRVVANGLEVAKRPRSSMSPTIVFDAKGKPLLLIGSAGGSRIITHVVKVLVGVLDWKLDIQTAIELDNFGNSNGATYIEDTDRSEDLKAALEALGHEVTVQRLMSGLNGIHVTSKGLDGGADPRRAGTAEGNP